MSSPRGYAAGKAAGIRIAILLGVLCARIAIAAEPAAAAGSATADARQHIGPVPQWVSELAVPDAGAPPAGADIQYLLVDRQLQYAETSFTYARHVLRLLNESGVQQNSQLNIDFDPEREKLRVHAVTLRRGARTIDALAGGRIEMLQRERNLERNLLDGSLTFHLLLADVRAGDTLEYSFTVERRDAEWDNRHYSRLTTAWDVPVRASRLRLRVGGDAPLRFALNREVQPVEARDGPWRVLEWNWRDLPGKSGESGTPIWHEQYPAVTLSQFATWRDVVTPSLRLYALPATQGPELTALVAKLRTESRTDAARALEAIRFVQEQVRYTGLELGAGAYKPTDPEVVLQRRYGDCKDKTLLAVALLRGLGFEAEPALVSTVWQSHLDARLPSPGAFDHVILRARVGGTHYWWDATSTAQGGGLADFVQSDLGAALLVAEGSDGITRIPLATPRSPDLNISVLYDLRAGLDAASSITVTTRHRGREADAMRRTLRSRTARELGEQYENYYKRIYPQLRAAAEPKITDDFAANLLTLEERYRTTELFEKPDAEGVRNFYLDADVITSSLGAPSTPLRTTPLALNYPVNRTVKLEVRLPEEWPVEASDVGIDDAFFQYRSRHRRIGNDVFLEFEYRTLAESIPVAKLDEHLQRREKARLDSIYELNYTPNADAAGGAVETLAQHAREILAGGRMRPAAETRRMIEELRKAKDWELLPEATRQGLAVVAGAIAFEEKDWKTAHDEMKQGIAISSDGELWSTYIEASSRADEPEDAADAAASLLETSPGEFRKFNDDFVLALVGDSERRGVARYRLLTAMFKGDYQRKDGLDVSGWWLGLLETQLERGQLEAARKTLARVREPGSLIEILADNRFEPVRSALAPTQQPDRAADAYIEFLRTAGRQNPRVLGVLLEVPLAQISALRFGEALQTLDALLKRARAPDGREYFTDYARQYRWLLDYRSTALRGMGRWDEALAQLREAQAVGGNSDLVSQGINLAGLYNSMGRAEDARAELAKIDGQKASEFGRRLMTLGALESAAQLHDEAESERQLEILGADRYDNPEAYLRSLIIASRLDLAAAQVLTMLEDPDLRSFMLKAAQRYPADHLSTWNQELNRRWQQVLQRPEVREAIGKLGKIGPYRWQSPMLF